MLPKIIEIDGSRWRTSSDAVDGLRAALGAVEGHGTGVDAFIDSMIYGGMLEAEPPYEVVVHGLASCEAAAFIEQSSQALIDASAWRKAHYGDDAHVALHVRA
jgi:hypothetical protein